MNKKDRWVIEAIYYRQVERNQRHKTNGSNNQQRKRREPSVREDLNTVLRILSKELFSETDRQAVASLD